ncbi:MAG: hypothetical protein ABI461_20805, partial [Polyangiaceae bacterium]
MRRAPLLILFVGGICGSAMACGSSLAAAPTSAVNDAGELAQDAAAVEAGPPVDNGAPSDQFPAPHPAFPTVQSYGGTVLASP